MSQELKWQGYTVNDTNKWTEFTVKDFKPKQFEETDIDIAIECCGVCGSDVHSITGGWGDIITPLITGHEIVGKAVKVGSQVKGFKVGDRVGVGAQVWSCGECNRCKNDQENYCAKQVDTYNAKYPNGDIAHGGYATAARVNERFCFHIPDSIPSEIAAPMMCAGLTVYSPLVRHGAGPGAVVGIVGIGGLGHLALQFAKALGCAEVVAISSSDKKREDAMKMGATDYIVHGGADGDNAKITEKYADYFDLILVTADVSEGIPLDLMSCLKVNKRFICVAMPDEALPPIKTQDFAGNGAMLGGGHIGSKVEAEAMLKLAAEKGVKTIIETLPMKEAGKAVQRVKSNEVRYRHVLINDLS